MQCWWKVRKMKISFPTSTGYMEKLWTSSALTIAKGFKRLLNNLSNNLSYTYTTHELFTQLISRLVASHFYCGNPGPSPNFHAGHETSSFLACPPRCGFLGFLLSGKTFPQSQSLISSSGCHILAIRWHSHLKNTCRVTSQLSYTCHSWVFPDRELILWESMAWY